MLRFRIGADYRRVTAAMQDWMSVISSVRVVRKALQTAKRQVKIGYLNKWKNAGYPGYSLWQKMKAQEGFFTTPGLFTGSTYRGIDYRLLNFGGGSASGEVSVLGFWPNTKPAGAGMGSSGSGGEGSIGTTGFSPSEMESLMNSSYDFLGSESSPWSGIDPEDLMISREEGAEPVDDSSWKVRQPKEGNEGFIDKSSGVRQILDSSIVVGPNGVIIQYPNSKPMRKPRELMRTKRYGLKSQPVDFMYLNEAETNTTISEVIGFVRAGLNR